MSALCPMSWALLPVSRAADRVRRDRPERIARPAWPGGRGGERSEPPLMIVKKVLTNRCPAIGSRRGSAGRAGAAGGAR